MSEKCPLSSNPKNTPRMYEFSELPRECAACLGRVAGRLNIRRDNTSLGIQTFEKGPKRLMLKGCISYYPIPGKSRSSIMDCDANTWSFGISDADSESLVIDRRCLEVKYEDEIIETWQSEELYKGHPNRVHLLKTLLSYAGQIYMVEELVYRLVYDFVIESAERDLRYAAHAISRMEGIFKATARDQRNIGIMMDIWQDILKDPHNQVAGVLQNIQEIRRKLPRKAKKDYSTRERGSLGPERGRTNIVYLDEVRRRRDS